MLIIDILLNYTPSIDAKHAVLPPFDSSRWDDSNELYYNFIWSLDAKEFNKTYFF